MYLQPSPEDVVALRACGVTSLHGLFEAVRATCVKETPTRMPGVLAAPRGMLLNWLNKHVSRWSRLQVPLTPVAQPRLALASPALAAYPVHICHLPDRRVHLLHACIPLPDPHGLRSCALAGTRGSPRRRLG